VVVDRRATMIPDLFALGREHSGRGRKSGPCGFPYLRNRIRQQRIGALPPQGHEAATTRACGIPRGFLYDRNQRLNHSGVWYLLPAAVQRSPRCLQALSGQRGPDPISHRTAAPSLITPCPTLGRQFTRPAIGTFERKALHDFRKNSPASATAFCGTSTMMRVPSRATELSDVSKGL